MIGSIFFFFTLGSIIIMGIHGYFLGKMQGHQLSVMNSNNLVGKILDISPVLGVITALIIVILI